MDGLDKMCSSHQEKALTQRSKIFREKPKHVKHVITLNTFVQNHPPVLQYIFQLLEYQMVVAGGQINQGQEAAPPLPPLYCF